MDFIHNECQYSLLVLSPGAQAIRVTTWFLGRPALTLCQAVANLCLQKLTSPLLFYRHSSKTTRKRTQTVRSHKSDKIAELPANGWRPEGFSNEKDGSQATGKASPIARMVETIKEKTPAGFRENYVAYGVCELLVKECARVAEYKVPQAANLDEEIPKTEKNEDIGIGTGWWYDGKLCAVASVSKWRSNGLPELGLSPTFNNWAQVTFLHMWCLTVRFRTFPKPSAATWQQQLTDQFFFLAEDKMVLLHRLNSRGVRARFLKDLFHQWRGLTLAYDVGLVKGDALLASAIWRNLCGANPDVDVVKLAQVVSYTRSVLYNLEKMDDYVLGKGDIIFGDPSEEADLVNRRSKMMDMKFEDNKPPEPISPGKR